MRAAVFHEVGKPLTIETVDDPRPQTGQIVIQISGAGICGSDLHMTQYPGFAAPGLILGHEFAGTVAALGDGVGGDWKVGDRVTAVPLFPCRDCEACDAHLPQLCPNGRFAGTTLETPGAYAQYISARADMVQRVPAGVGDNEAAMIEPLAVGHHTFSRAEMRKGESVLIIGGGPIGAAVALFARAAGAAHVVVSEPAPERRERCLSLGATATIDPAKEDLGQRFTAIAGGRPSVVFECVGIGGMVQQAVNVAAIRGRVVVAGVLFEEDRLSHVAALGKEISIIYSQAYNERDFEAVIDALARNVIDARPMHTATVSLNDLPAMFESLRNAPSQCKVLIDPAL